MTPVLVRTAAGVACAATLAGCTASAPLPVAGVSSPAVTTTASPLKTCGQVTPSTGVLGKVLQVRLSGPSRLASGSIFHGTVTVSLRPGVNRHEVNLTSGAPILPVIARGADVVGRYEGAVGGVGIGATVRVDRPFHFPTSSSVLLRGCPDRPIDGMAPDQSRKPLPAGPYTIYAYVDDYSGNDTSKYGVLRSQPFGITVTAKIG